MTTEKKRKEDLMLGKAKKYALPIILTMFFTTGTVTIFGVDLSNVFKQEFTEEQKTLLLDNAKEQKEMNAKLKIMIKDYDDSAMTFTELSEHSNDKDLHMKYREKIKEFVTNDIYKKFLETNQTQIENLSTKMDLLLANSMGGTVQ